MKEIKALINFKDCVVNKDIKKGDNILDIYKESNVELTEDRIKVLLKGNLSNGNKPFVEIKEVIDETPVEEESKKTKKSKK